LKKFDQKDSTKGFYLLYQLQEEQLKTNRTVHLSAEQF